MSVPKCFQSQAADFYDRIQKLVPRLDDGLNSRGQNVETSSTLSVSVPINLSIKLDFVSVNSSRETYFVDAPRIMKIRGLGLINTPCGAS